MTLQQGIEIAQKAKAIGYAVQAEKGKVRFVIVSYAKDGQSTVQPITKWVSGYDEAMSLLSGE